MAWSAQKNTIYFQRLQNYAVALQNVREEGARLQAILSLEASPSGVDDAAFIDTSIATKAAAKSLIGLAGEVKLFMENGTVTAFNRQDLLVPFTDTTPA